MKKEKKKKNDARVGMLVFSARARGHLHDREIVSFDLAAEVGDAQHAELLHAPVGRGRIGLLSAGGGGGDSGGGTRRS